MELDERSAVEELIPALLMELPWVWNAMGSSVIRLAIPALLAGADGTAREYLVQNVPWSWVEKCLPNGDTRLPSGDAELVAYKNGGTSIREGGWRIEGECRCSLCPNPHHFHWPGASGVSWRGRWHDLRGRIQEGSYNGSVGVSVLQNDEYDVIVLAPYMALRSGPATELEGIKFRIDPRTLSVTRAAAGSLTPGRG
jgi:hypothetical protein